MTGTWHKDAALERAFTCSKRTMSSSIHATHGRMHMYMGAASVAGSVLWHSWPAMAWLQRHSAHMGDM